MIVRLILVVVLSLVATSSFAEPPAISSEDTLRWENLALKMQLHQERLQTIQSQVNAAQGDLERERKALDEHFRATYKVPLAQLQRKDGKWEVIPSPAK